MRNSLPHPVRTLNTKPQPPGPKVNLHYIVDGNVLRQTENRLIADARFFEEVSIPVRHRLIMGGTK